MKKKRKIVIVGCGPKALAIYSKVQALKSLGWEVPEIVVIEKNDIGANWSGDYGYTDGKSTLAISPLKDVGYPYESIFGKEVDFLMEKYSFVSYLKSQNRFTAWVDGGNLPITHNDMSRYLKWISSELKLNPIIGEVVKLIPKDQHWEVFYKNKGIEYSLTCDALVATGPGEVHKKIITPVSANIYDAKDFWLNLNKFASLNNEKIALIGSGTSGGTIFERLMPLLDNKSHVDWYTRRGIYTRSENFINNQIFSHSNRWTEIPEKFRKEFIQHTDRGSIDITIHKVMAQFHEKFSVVFGEPEKIGISKNGLIVNYPYGSNISKKIYDKVIIATGFDNLNFLSWLPENFKQEKIFTDSEIDMAKRLGNDLSIPEVTPKLHLPMLAWYNYGISLSELSCLSTLSDKILETHVTKKYI